MDGNYVQTGRYCYKIGRYYTCTDDEGMASVYFGLRLLEKMGNDFDTDLMELNVRYQIWAKEHKMTESSSVKTALEIFEKARKMLAKDMSPATYQEIYDIAISAMPYLIKAEEELHNNVRIPGGGSPARLLEIKKEMEENNNDDNYQWKNLKLIREAYDLIKENPDAMEGAYSNEKQKVIFLNSIIGLCPEGDCSRLSFEIRSYIAEFFSRSSFFVRREFSETIKDNAFKLEKRRMYNDPNVSVKEFCQKYEIALVFDEFFRSERWERISYEIYRLVDQTLGDPARYGENYYAMNMLATRMTLNENNIDFKDEIQLNWESDYRRFSFEICGKTIYTDYLDLYNAYVAIRDLQLKDSHFLDCLEYAYKKIADWKKTIDREKTLEQKEDEALTELVELFRETVDAYKEEGDYDLALQAVTEAITLLNDFEHYLRYGYADGYDDEDDEEEVEEDAVTSSGNESAVEEQEYEDEWKLRDRILELAKELESHDGGENNTNTLGIQMKKSRVLTGLKSLIENYKNHYDLYMEWALFSSCDNWGTYEGLREEEFIEKMIKGIQDYGCLTPDREIDWYILARVNDEYPFFLGSDPNYDFSNLLNTAIEEGDETVRGYARTIMEENYE